jgi:hypothetical protein
MELFVFARRLTASLALAAAVALLAAPAPAAAAVTVVTQPAGAATLPDAFPGFDIWYRDDVRAGSSAGITTDFARSGAGSMLLTGTSSVSKANLAYYFAPTEYAFTTLGNFASVGYDAYRASSSTTAAHLAPALRLLVDADGNLATSGDRGSLVYEPVYNGTPVSVDQWMSTTVGSATNLWFYQSGRGVEEVFDRTLAAYQSGAYTSTASFAHLSGSSLVYGVSFGTGSGWSGTYTGAVDNVTIALRDGGSTTFNFEPAAPTTATPEPASLALVGGGLLLLGGIVARRRGRDA